MEIRVQQSDWSGANPSDIAVLLANVAHHLTRPFRQPLIGSIVVAATESLDDDPITLYRSSPIEPFRILLSARGGYWCQFAYQFSHELCHVLTDYERLKENPNNWFHEAICELASIFALRRMAEGWLTCPPYPNRYDYAESLGEYAQNYLSREERQLPAGMTLSHWLTEKEEILRANRYQRDRNAVVAYSLLPSFEQEPSGWNAIRNLPVSSTRFRDYLLEWRSQVEDIDQPFVDRIIRLFE